MEVEPSISLENDSIAKPISLPQKKYFRQRAHANPRSDHCIDYPRTPDDMNWENYFGPSAVGKRVEFLDVGCGYGGLLVKLSTMYPEILMCGLEIRVKVSDFVQQKILALRNQYPGKYENVCCLRSNAMKYLPNYFRKHQLSKMFFLYPDPHFKTAKHKWRIITKNLLSEYAYCLKPSGIVYTITDVEELHVWIVRTFEKHPLYKRLTEEELAEDPIVPLLGDTTEEGQKVNRNKGSMFSAVFIRLDKPRTL